MSEETRSAKRSRRVSDPPAGCSSSQSPPRSDERCSICLGPPDDACQSDGCTHRFCFVCLCEWAKVKHECPMCKKPFKSIRHRFGSREAGGPREGEVFVPEPIRVATTRRAAIQGPVAGERAEIRRHVRELQARLRNFDEATRCAERIERLDRVGGRFSRWLRQNNEQTIAARIQDGRRRLIEGIQRYQHLLDRTDDANREALMADLTFRRLIYERELTQRPVPTDERRTRQCSPRFFRRNEAMRNRLVPWITRELGVLMQGDRARVSELSMRILLLIQRYHILSLEFARDLMGLVPHHTHFIRELYAFANSPHDLVEEYDRHSQYIREGTSPVPVVGDSNNGIVSHDDETSRDGDNGEIEVVAESARLREAQRRRRADDRHSERLATVDFHDLHDRRQRAIRSAVDQIQERLEGIRRNAFTLPHYFPPISTRGEAAATEEGARVAGRVEEGSAGFIPRTAGGFRGGESATRLDRMGEEVGAPSSTIASTVLGSLGVRFSSPYIGVHPSMLPTAMRSATFFHNPSESSTSAQLRSNGETTLLHPRPRTITTPRNLREALFGWSDRRATETTDAASATSEETSFGGYIGSWLSFARNTAGNHLHTSQATTVSRTDSNNVPCANADPWSSSTSSTTSSHREMDDEDGDDVQCLHLPQSGRSMSSGIVIGEEGDDDDVVFLASASESSELQRVDDEETVRDRNRRSSRAAVGSSLNSSLATTASFELDRDEDDDVVHPSNRGDRDSGEEIRHREMIANPEGVNEPESPSTSAQRMRLRPRILRGGDTTTLSRRLSPRSHSNIAAVVAAVFSKTSHNEASSSTWNRNAHADDEMFNKEMKQTNSGDHSPDVSLSPRMLRSGSSRSSTPSITVSSGSDDEQESTIAADDSDVEVLAVLKPRHLRTPPLVEIDDGEEEGNGEGGGQGRDASAGKAQSSHLDADQRDVKGDRRSSDYRHRHERPSSPHEFIRKRHEQMLRYSNHAGEQQRRRPVQADESRKRRARDFSRARHRHAKSGDRERDGHTSSTDSASTSDKMDEEKRRASKRLRSSSPRKHTYRLRIDSDCQHGRQEPGSSSAMRGSPEAQRKRPQDTTNTYGFYGGGLYSDDDDLADGDW